MAIRQFSQERRNIMIPGYWRYQDHYTKITPTAMNTTTAWTSLGASYTFWLPIDNAIVMPEDSRFKFNFHGFLDKINADGLESCRVRLYNITDAESEMSGGGHVEHQGDGAGKALFDTVEVSFVVTAGKGAGPWQFEWQYYVWAQPRVQFTNSAWWVDVCRQ